jgi:HlyD family type I secretion membrane fusion protein
MSAWKSLVLPPVDAEAGVNLGGIVRAGTLFVLAVLLGMGLWMTFAPLSGAIIAPGMIKVDLNRKVVQHQEGGIVKQALVRDGQRVEQGQPLVLLGDVRVDAQLELLRKQYDAERVKTARLEAERAFPARLALPRELLSRSKEPPMAETIERETALYQARRALLESQIALLNRQIEETREEIVSLAAQVKADDRALALQKDELAMNEDLLRQNFVQRSRVMTIDRSVAEYESRREEHSAELAKARQRITDLQLRIAGLTSNFRQQAADELKDSTTRLIDVQQRLRPSEDASRRQTVVAPVAGQVVNLQVFTAGAVIGPRELIAEIVPDRQQLIVEGRVQPEDITYVKDGGAADVRITAFKQRTTPLIAGAVNYVSGDRIVDPRTGTGAYIIHVELSPESVKQAGDAKLQAGMPAEIYVRTDTRTALDYLLAPVTAYLRRSMREPL